MFAVPLVCALSRSVLIKGIYTEHTSQLSRPTYICVPKAGLEGLKI